MRPYHVAVRTLDGQHLVSARVEVERVSDIGLQRDGKDVVSIVTHGDIVATGPVPERAAKEKLVLARWDIDVSDEGVEQPVNFHEEPVLKRL